MSYFIVKSEGKYYASRALIKAVYPVGDAGLLVLLEDRKTEQKKILDSVVYTLTDAQVKNLTKPDTYAVLQDLDKQTELFSASLPTKYYEHCVSRDCSSFVYGTFEYVRVMDIRLHRKYHLACELPVITFLSKKYVALDCCLKDKENPSVLSYKTKTK